MKNFLKVSLKKSYSTPYQNLRHQSILLLLVNTLGLPLVPLFLVNIFLSSKLRQYPRLWFSYIWTFIVFSFRNFLLTSSLEMSVILYWLPRGHCGKESACQCRRWGLDFPGQEDPLAEEMAIHCSILAWEISWTEEPGGLQSRVLQRVRHNWVNEHTRHSLPTKELLLFNLEFLFWPLAVHSFSLFFPCSPPPTPVPGLPRTSTPGASRCPSLSFAASLCTEPFLSFLPSSRWPRLRFNLPCASSWNFLCSQSGAEICHPLRCHRGKSFKLVLWETQTNWHVHHIQHLGEATVMFYFNHASVRKTSSAGLPSALPLSCPNRKPLPQSTNQASKSRLKQAPWQSRAFHPTPDSLNPQSW